MPPALKTTVALRNMVNTYHSQISTEEFEELLWDIDVIYQDFFKELSGLPAGIERGRRLHQLLELETKRNDNIAVTCKKGCAACCHLEVEITKDEALVINEAVRNGVPLDFERMNALAQRDRQGAQWHRGVVDSNRCLFLGDDNACTIYESRPSSCRRLAVTSAAAECARGNEGRPTPRLLPTVEILISAAMNLPQAQLGSMAKMVQASFVQETILPETILPLLEPNQKPENSAPQAKLFEPALFLDPQV